MPFDIKTPRFHATNIHVERDEWSLKNSPAQSAPLSEGWGLACPFLGGFERNRLSESQI